jgi:hypothetical protein
MNWLVSAGLLKWLDLRDSSLDIEMEESKPDQRQSRPTRTALAAARKGQYLCEKLRFFGH